MGRSQCKPGSCCCNAVARGAGPAAEAVRPAGYRRLWSARTASQWGDVFATVALSLLVLDLTGSALGVVAVVAVEIVDRVCARRGN